jgi:hypothetical protein
VVLDLLDILRLVYHFGNRLYGCGEGGLLEVLVHLLHIAFDFEYELGELVVAKVDAVGGGIDVLRPEGVTSR